MAHFLCDNTIDIDVLDTSMKDLVDSAVESSGKVPKEFKQQMKNWIHDLVSTISTRGWNNVPDMTLSNLYGKRIRSPETTMYISKCSGNNC